MFNEFGSNPRLSATADVSAADHFDMA